MDATLKQDDLADPDQVPGRDIVIYDGQCRFCTDQVRQLARWDARGTLAFLSLHDPRTRALCPDLTHADLMEQIFLVTAAGNRYAGAAALRYLSRHLRRLWLLAPLLHIPGSLGLWQRLYRQVARRRYRLATRRESCDAHDCDLHAR